MTKESTRDSIPDSVSVPLGNDGTNDGFVCESNDTEKHETTTITGVSISAAKGRILLGLVALLYGTQVVATKFTYDVPEIPPSPAAQSTVQGWLAFLFFLPPLMFGNKKPKHDAEGIQQQLIPLFRSGLELAFWNFSAMALLNVGLLSTQSARASFLMQMSVLFTPLISIFLGKQSVTKTIWFACMVTLIGLFILAMGDSSTASSLALSVSKGDLFILGGALSWSMYLFRLSILGPKYSDIALQGVKTGLVAVLYSVWWLVSTAVNTPGGLSSISFGSLPSWMTASYTVWIALLYLATGTGTIADILQQKGQNCVSSSEASILLSTEPVFAAIFGLLLLDEKPSVLEMVGGALILAAAAIVAVGEGRKPLDDVSCACTIVEITDLENALSDDIETIVTNKKRRAHSVYNTIWTSSSNGSESSKLTRSSFAVNRRRLSYINTL